MPDTVEVFCSEGKAEVVRLLADQAADYDLLLGGPCELLDELRARVPSLPPCAGRQGRRFVFADAPAVSVAFPGEARRAA